jgi:glycerol-3-phosphate dehydrogenase
VKFPLKSLLSSPLKTVLRQVDFVKVAKYLASLEPGKSYLLDESKPGPAFPDQDRVAKLGVDLAERYLEEKGERPNRQELQGQMEIISCRYDWELHRQAKGAFFNLITHVFQPRDLQALYVSKDERELRHLHKLRAAQDDNVGVIYLINHTSHFDEFIFNVFLDNLGLNLPLFAAGANMMVTPSLTKLFMLGSYVIVRKGATRAYLASLFHYCQALAELGKPQGIFLEAWSGGARTRDGSLRYPRRLYTIQGALACRGDTLVQPVVISYSRVPEDRDLSEGKSLSSWFAGHHAVKGLLTHPFHPLKGLASGFKNLFGRTYVAFGEGRLLSDLKKEWEGDAHGLELDEFTALYAIKEIARDKKVMTSHLAALGLANAVRHKSQDVVAGAAEALEVIREYHHRVFDAEPDLEDFIRDEPLEKAVADGLESLRARGVVGPKPLFKKRLPKILSSHGLSYYGTHSDRRLYSPSAKENMVVCGSGPWGYAMVTFVGRRVLNDRKFHNSSLSLYDSQDEIIGQLADSRAHPLFADYRLPKNVFPTSDGVEAFRKANDVIVAAPPEECDGLFKTILGVATDLRSLILASRGFDPLSHRLPIQMAWEAAVAAGRPDLNVLALSGPFEPQDLLTNKGGSWILAGPQREGKLPEASLFKMGPFKVEILEDPLGVQIAAALTDAYTLHGSYLKAHRELKTPEAMTNFVREVSAEAHLLAMALGAKLATFNAGSPAWIAEFLYAVLSASRHPTIKMAAQNGGESFREFLNDANPPISWPDRGLLGYYSIHSAHLIAKNLSLKTPCLERANSIFWGD